MVKHRVVPTRWFRSIRGIPCLTSGARDNRPRLKLRKNEEHSANRSALGATFAMLVLRVSAMSHDPWTHSKWNPGGIVESETVMLDLSSSTAHGGNAESWTGCGFVACLNDGNGNEWSSCITHLATIRTPLANAGGGSFEHSLTPLSARPCAEFHRTFAQVHP